MRFIKKGDVYRVVRLTGAQDNILGITFGKNQEVEIIPWPIEKNQKIHTTKKEVFNQVINGLKFVNESLETNYELSKIYFVPSDISSNSVYHLLICQLIRHYHSGKEFKEV